jgi:hypothetical protein
MPEYGMETSSFARHKKLKMYPTAGKLMLTVFWGAHKGYYWNIMKRGVQQ